MPSACLLWFRCFCRSRWPLLLPRALSGRTPHRAGFLLSYHTRNGAVGRQPLLQRPRPLAAAFRIASKTVGYTDPTLVCPARFPAQPHCYIATITHTMNFKFASTALASVLARTARRASSPPLSAHLHTQYRPVLVAQVPAAIRAPRKGRCSKRRSFRSVTRTIRMWTRSSTTCCARYDFDSSRACTACSLGVSYSATAVKLVMPSPTPATKNWRAYQARFSTRCVSTPACASGAQPGDAATRLRRVRRAAGSDRRHHRRGDDLRALHGQLPRARRADHAHLRLPEHRQSRGSPGDVPQESRRLPGVDARLQIDPTTVLGSYTGAIGIPQFLPSSIVHTR